MKFLSLFGGAFGPLALAGGIAAGGTGLPPLPLPSPKGPPQPKVKKVKNPRNESADGRALDVEKEAVKAQKNSYDKNGLLKKPKQERRRLKRKVGPRKFLGITLPFQR